MIDFGAGPIDPSVVRIAWRFGGYGNGRGFPGVRKAVRQMAREFGGVVRLAVSLAVACARAWRLLLHAASRPASVARVSRRRRIVSPPAAHFYLVICPAVGPPAFLAAPEALAMIGP